MLQFAQPMVFGMYNHTVSLRVLLAAFSLIGVLLGGDLQAQTAMNWTTAPSYESAGDPKTQFVIKDTDGTDRKMYDESYAVLIVEGAYNRGGWNAVTEAAAKSERILRKKLEDFGFHVLIWRDISGASMRTLLDEILSNIGYIDDARLFFYYFGHGTSIGTQKMTINSPRLFWFQ